MDLQLYRQNLPAPVIIHL